MWKARITTLRHSLPPDALNERGVFPRAPVDSVTYPGGEAMTASGEAPIQISAPASAIRVLHLAQSDGGGGANKAAFRLHRSLRDLGLASTFHPGRKVGDDPDVIPAWPPIAGDFISKLAAWLDSHSLDFYRDRRGDVFSPIRFCYGRPRRRLVAAADVVCLHWIAGSFLHPRHLAQLHKPLVWRLSDLWPFTGGCHFPADCRKFEERCSSCPSLGSTADDDLAARQLRGARAVLRRSRSHRRGAEPVDCGGGQALEAFSPAADRAHPDRYRRLDVSADAARAGRSVCSAFRVGVPMLPVRRDGFDDQQPARASPRCAGRSVSFAH